MVLRRVSIWLRVEGARARALGLPLAFAGLAAVLAVGCSRGGGSDGIHSESRNGVPASPRLVHSGPIPRGGGRYKIGEPYQVAGRWYTPRADPAYDRTGVASWYGEAFHGRQTSNGEVFDMHALTAAHPTLPLPSLVEVTSLDSGRTVLVRVNDRGPFAHDRLIDLSRQSARLLGIERAGTGRVRVRYAGPAPLDGDDRRERRFVESQPWSSPLAGTARPATMWPGRFSLGH